MAYGTYSGDIWALVGVYLDVERRQNKHQKVKREWTRGFDRTLLILTLVMMVLGLVAVAEASSPQALSTFSDPFYFVKQQLMWAGLGVVVMVVASFVPYGFWRKMALPIFGVSILCLVAVLVPGVGVRLLGARRWISVGGIGFQPSELVKLTMIIFLARLLELEKPYWWSVVIIGLVAGLIMLQPDLGTTIVVVGIGFGQLFVGGMSLVLMGLLGVMGVGLGFLMVMFSDYRRARLTTFLESSTDPQGTSYHIRQILIALGSGGMFGVGLGRSRQKHLFLPETATDSVFAVVGEETGFLGAGLVVILFSVLILRMFKVAVRAPDKFSSVLAAGIAIWLGSQGVVNLAAMVSLVPLTGIPLPFFSYGGSSLTMALMSVGILLNISKHEKNEAKIERRVRGRKV